jgi:NADPH-dependent 2,4-dienoyl-CoA reductase/sulfur reductase-like enzyme
MECFRILNDGLPLGCTLNPVLGREFEYGDEKLVRDGAGRTVAVIGGGPAGMEATLRKAYVDKLICVLTFKAAC